MAVSDPQRDYYSRLLTAYRGRTIKRGTHSRTVRALQLYLRDQGYDIKADGVFGPKTEAAVRKWQAAQGLSPDGQVGKKSLTNIREKVTPTPRPRPSKATPSFTPEVTRSPTSVPGLGTPSRLTQKDETLDQINRNMIAARERAAAPPASPTVSPTSVPSEPMGPALAAQSSEEPGLPPPPPTSELSPTAAPGALGGPPVPGGAPTDVGDPSALASALAGGGGVAQPPMDVGNFVPPPAPRPQPGPGAMAHNAMQPLREGRFPGLPPVPPELPQGEMTPEDVALIQALLQSRTGRTPPVTGPAF